MLFNPDALTAHQDAAIPQCSLISPNTSRVGIRTGRVGHQLLYQPDTTLSGTSNMSSPARHDKSHADLNSVRSRGNPKYFCPVPAEIYVGCPRFDPTSNIEMGNGHISPELSHFPFR